VPRDVVCVVVEGDVDSWLLADLIGDQVDGPVDAGLGRTSVERV
jgi:hypothetical protein